MQSDSERLGVDVLLSSAQPLLSTEADQVEKVPSTPPTLATDPKELVSMADGSSSLPSTSSKKDAGQNARPKMADKRELAKAQALQEQCRRLVVTLFADEATAVKSLGFTSSLAGEGKSFLATVTARLLAHDSLRPVTLVECNWDHPTLDKTFGIPAKPGLAEWLSGMCDEREMRYKVEENLTVIPAGDGSKQAVKLLKRLQQEPDWQKILGQDGLLILDLPPVIATGYGTLAASLADKVVIVVRSEVTPAHMLVETCAQLKKVPVHGVIINQENSRIPRWIRQIL